MTATDGSSVAADQADEYQAAVAMQAAARMAEAIAAFDVVLARDPWHVGALLHAAAIALANGDETAASLYYQTLFNLGDDEIIAAAAQTDLLPTALDSLIGLCRSLDRMPLARAILDALLAARPDHAHGHFTLGRLLLEGGETEPGLAHLRRAVVSDDALADAWVALGIAQRDHGELGEAQTTLERAVALDPDAHLARINLARLYLQQGRESEMLRQFRMLARALDDDASMLNETGFVLLTNGDPHNAAVAFEKALVLVPDDYAANLGLGAVRLRQERNRDAIEHLHRAMSHLPENPTAILMLTKIIHRLLPRRLVGAMLSAAGDAAWEDPSVLIELAETAYHARLGDAALRALSRLYELTPDDGRVLPALLDAKLSVCEWSGTESLEREVLSTVEQSISAGLPLNIDVWNLFAIGVDYPTLARAARYKAQQIYDTVADERAACNFGFGTPKQRRIRLGYLCPYTWKSSHIDNLLTVVRHHDRDRFELFGYSIQMQNDDDYDETFCGLFDAFRVVPLSRLEESAQQIFADEIDILFDSTGHFAATCMPIAAMRPAPVIVHGSAGFNIIGAAPFYDYSLNDRHYLTEDLADLYVEKPYYMPHSAMPAELLPMDDSPFTRGDFGIPEDRFVFADFNHPCKYDPKIYTAWMEILRRVPDSMLLLGNWMEDTVTRLHRLAEAHGVEAERVVFARFQARPRHLRRLQLCDLALDTFYHCGGVTTVDCLIAGLPIVTAVPDRQLPLANLSLLAAMGLEGLVMPSLSAYVEKAVALAQSPDELAALRARMWANRETAPLFQAERWVRNHERACEIIHRRRLDGDPPAQFSVLDVRDWPD